MSDKYKLLQDKPLSGTEYEKVAFGHKSVIRTLSDVIQTCITPFTIGLFGKWGTGKSTIAEQLKETLITKQIPTIIFDVWKHEGDALRRTFLIEMVDQLNNNFGSTAILKKQIVIDSRLQSGTNSTKSHFDIKWKRLLLHLLVMAMVFGLFILTFSFTKFFGIEGFSAPQLATILGAIITAGFASKYIESFIETEKTDIKYDKFQDPHEFEKEFHRILECVNAERILIVFDNIDRVNGETALKIVSAIKTFLEPSQTGNDKQQLVFMIPCDVNAIKSHISQALEKDATAANKDMYSDEFLRKFFNTVLWIPEFYQTDLENFTKQKLLETAIPEFDDDNILWLINKVFCKNIRQVVQFINVLTINYTLLKNNSEDGNLAPDFYKKNLPQLAKYLLILQRFPSIMDRFKEHAVYDMEANNYQETIVNNKSEHNTFKKFLLDTDQIKIASLEAFLTNKISEDEQQLSGISGWLLELESNSFQYDHEKIVALQLDVPERNNAFSKIIKNRLQTKLNAVSGPLFINNLLLCIRDAGLKLRNTSFHDISNSLNDQAWLVRINHIDPELLDFLFLRIAGIDGVRMEIVYHAQVSYARELASNSKAFPAAEERYLEKCMKSWMASRTRYSHQLLSSINSLMINYGYRFPELLNIMLTCRIPKENLIESAVIMNYFSMCVVSDYNEQGEISTKRMNNLRMFNLEQLNAEELNSSLGGINRSIDLAKSHALFVSGSFRTDYFFKNVAHLISQLLPAVQYWSNEEGLKNVIDTLINMAESNNIPRLYLLPVALHLKSYAIDNINSEKLLKAFEIDFSHKKIESHLQFLDIAIEDKAALFSEPMIKTQVLKFTEYDRFYQFNMNLLQQNTKKEMFEKAINKNNTDSVFLYLKHDRDSFDYNGAVNWLIKIMWNTENVNIVKEMCNQLMELCKSPEEKEQMFGKIVTRKVTDGNDIYLAAALSTFNKAIVSSRIMNSYVQWIIENSLGDYNEFNTAFISQFVDLIDNTNMKRALDYLQNDRRHTGDELVKISLLIETLKIKIKEQDYHYTINFSESRLPGIGHKVPKFDPGK